ncbi:MAG: hypothetical protein ACOC5T_06390 [Elusimicrobiota bacterium]
MKKNLKIDRRYVLSGMILERGHFGKAKVCGMRNKLLYNIPIKGKINNDTVLSELSKNFNNKDRLLFDNAFITKKNDDEWEVNTKEKSYAVKKGDNGISVYETLDELKGSMITVPVAAQNKLGWQNKTDGEKRVDCLSTSRDVILYRMISYEPLHYKMYLKNLDVDWERLADENLKLELLRTIVLAPSLEGVYVTLDILYPDDNRFDKFREYFRRIHPFLPGEMKETYECTSFHFTLSSRKLCEELYKLINSRKKLGLLLKERGFVDFYWQLLKDLSEDSQKHVQNIADTLLTITNPKNRKNLKKSFKRLQSITKTVRLKIWANYSYAINIAFGHRGILLAPHLTIMRGWDGVLLYLKRLVDEFKELNEDDLKEYKKTIYNQIYKMAKIVKEIVDLVKENLDENETRQVIKLLAYLYSETEISQEDHKSIKVQKVTRNISFILDRLTIILRQILYMSPQNLFSIKKEDSKRIEDILDQRKKLFRVTIGKKLISLPKEVRRAHNWDENTRLDVFSPSDHTLIYYRKNATPIKLSFDLNKIPIEISEYDESVLHRLIKDIIIVGSLIGPNVKVSLKLPQKFNQRRCFQKICREIRYYIETADWEDNFTKAEFTYSFGLTNKTFREILGDMCRRFENTITILTNIRKLSDIENRDIQLLRDYSEESMKFFEKQFSIAINITFSRGGLELSYYYIIWRFSLIAWNIYSIVKDLEEFYNSEYSCESNSLSHIQQTFDEGVNLLKDTIKMINPLEKSEVKKALDILCRSLMLQKKLSDFEESINQFERKIFENIWRITDHIVSISKFWMYEKPIKCLDLEKVKLT